MKFKRYAFLGTNASQHYTGFSTYAVSILVSRSVIDSYRLVLTI